ncbi:T9SS type A sorting domain-containing protein [Polaribacter sp. M15]
MKKKLLYLFITISSIGFSQTLETTYTTSGYDEREKPNFAFNIDGETKFYTLDWTNNQVNIYNSSHNIYKTVSINLESGYEMRELYLPTDKLFNSNSKIEFIIFSVQTDSPYQPSLRLFDEDGTLLFDFGNSRGIELFKTPNDSYKLITAQSTSNEKEISYKVYSLSGTLSVSQENLFNKQKIIGFPNPSSKTISITNPLKNNVNDKIKVYDINGRKVLEKTIVGNGENIELDISLLSKGIYNYRIRELGNKFVKE